MTDRDDRTAEQIKADMRAALDVLENYVTFDGKLDARKLTDELTNLAAENERLREHIAHQEVERDRMKNRIAELEMLLDE